MIARQVDVLYVLHYVPVLVLKWLPRGCLANCNGLWIFFFLFFFLLLFNVCTYNYTKLLQLKGQ